jgi:hypothetical protein
VRSIPEIINQVQNGVGRAGNNNKYAPKPAGQTGVHSRNTLKQSTSHACKRSSMFVYSSKFAWMLRFLANPAHIAL